MLRWVDQAFDGTGQLPSLSTGTISACPPALIRISRVFWGTEVVAMHTDSLACSSTAEEPVAVVLTEPDPSRPKRGGWWNRLAGRS